MMTLPPSAERCRQRLEDAGFAAYAVGGCVRDLQVGLTPGDYDLCTNALPWQIRQVFQDHKLVLAGEKHGTVAVGKDMMEAFDQTDVLNKAATIYMTAKNFGFTAEGMTPEAVHEIRTVFNLPDKR